jgi:hypothetical protein
MVFFLVVKGPKADATDAPHGGFFCNPVMKMTMMIIIFVLFLVMEHRWNEIDREKPKYSGKTCPSVTLSTINPTGTDPGSNPGLRGRRPAANRLNHGTVCPLGVIRQTQIFSSVSYSRASSVYAVLSV